MRSWFFSNTKRSGLRTFSFMMSDTRSTASMRPRRSAVTIYFAGVATVFL